MKKIIATVLAMVMALALCTTAFAAEGDKTIGSKTYTRVQAEVTGDGVLHRDAYYSLDGIFYSIDENDNVTKLTDAQVTALQAGYYTGIKLYKSASAVTCEDAGVLCNVYTDGTNYFVTEADYKANKTTFTDAVKVYVGEDGLHTTVYYKLNANTDADIAAGHAFYATSDKVGASKQTVYACATCGLKVVENADGDTTKNLTKVTVSSSNSTDTILASKGIALSLKKTFEANSVVYQYAAASTTTTGTTTSPKTFDAGIAMYVGMALTSVAGSAVVIGKKKEF